jgi:glycine hydroxymethyltransferase
MAVYFTLLQPGDTVLGMNLAHGGHLTHGHPLNFSGKLYTIVPYGVRQDDERIDYDELERLAHRAQAEDDHGRARAPTRESSTSSASARRPCGRRQSRDRHGAHRRPGRREGPSQPCAPFRLRDTTTHKTLRGPRGGLVLSRAEYAKDLDRSVFPGVQGGPLMHVIAAKAVCFKEALEPGFADYQRQVVANARASPRRCRPPASGSSAAEPTIT